MYMYNVHCVYSLTGGMLFFKQHIDVEMGYSIQKLYPWLLLMMIFPRLGRPRIISGMLYIYLKFANKKIKIRNSLKMHDPQGIPNLSNAENVVAFSFARI